MVYLFSMRRKMVMNAPSLLCGTRVGHLWGFSFSLSSCLTLGCFSCRPFAGWEASRAPTGRRQAPSKCGGGPSSRKATAAADRLQLTNRLTHSGTLVAAFPLPSSKVALLSWTKPRSPFSVSRILICCKFALLLEAPEGTTTSANLVTQCYTKKGQKKLGQVLELVSPLNCRQFLLFLPWLTLDFALFLPRFLPPAVDFFPPCLALESSAEEASPSEKPPKPVSFSYSLSSMTPRFSFFSSRYSWSSSSASSFVWAAFRCLPVDFLAILPALPAAGFVLCRAGGSSPAAAASASLFLRFFCLCFSRALSLRKEKR